MKKTFLVISMLVVLALALTACGTETTELGYCERDGNYYFSLYNPGTEDVIVDDWGIGTIGPGESAIGSIMWEGDYEGDLFWCPPLPDRWKVVIPEMWLLTKGTPTDGSVCILIAESHPSTYYQSLLCYPETDPTWVADSAPCAEPVSFNGSDDFGTWGCDGLLETWDSYRLPLYREDGNDLWHVYEGHLDNLAGD